MSQVLDRLTGYLSENVSEVMVNRPGMVYVDRIGQAGFEMHHTPEITRDTLDVFAGEVAGSNHKIFNEGQPLLHSTLPTGERVQVVRPPACVDEQFIVSIRRNLHRKLPLSFFTESKYFDDVAIIENAEAHRLETAMQGQSIQLLRDNKVAEGLKQAVIERKSIMVCGPMSSGKTALASALLDCIDKEERIGVIEDTEELDFDLPNSLRLLANEDNPHYNGAKLIQVCFRLLLGRIIVGELRNSLVVQYFRSLMTACKGNITTAHATSPHEAIELITDLYREAVPRATPADIKRMFKATIDIVVFINYDGKVRDCGSVYLPKLDESLG